VSTTTELNFWIDRLEESQYLEVEADAVNRDRTSVALEGLSLASCALGKSSVPFIYETRRTTSVDSPDRRTTALEVPIGGH
jgi:hypothetical protein